MNAERIANRIEELRSTAKQHEAVLMQISGAVQELTNLLAELSKEQNASNSIHDPQGT
jgi:prefoldin subunit 5